MEELVELVVGLVVDELIYGEIFHGDEEPGVEWNTDYESKDLTIGKWYGSDIDTRNYEKDVYKELKEMRFRGVISKEEYNKLVSHQKKVDERNKQFKKILNMKCNTVEESKKVLYDLKQMILDCYSKNEISKETYDEVNTKIEDKLIQLNNEKK